MRGSAGEFSKEEGIQKKGLLRLITVKGSAVGLALELVLEDCPGVSTGHTRIGMRCTSALLFNAFNP